MIAYVERYRYVQLEPTAWLEEIQNTGARLQCDIGSLSGQYGTQPQAFARGLLDRALPTFWGTDLHRTTQLARYFVPGLAKLRQHGTPVNAILAGLHTDG